MIPNNQKYMKIVMSPSGVQRMVPVMVCSPSRVVPVPASQVMFRLVTMVPVPVPVPGAQMLRQVRPGASVTMVQRRPVVAVPSVHMNPMPSVHMSPIRIQHLSLQPSNCSDLF